MRSPSLVERIVASFSYITMGMVGFIWLIIGLFTRANLSSFMKYHIFQSIFLSLGFTVVSVLLGWISNFLSIIPFINKLVAQIVFLLNMPLILNYSLIQFVVYTIVLYLAITALVGQKSYLPWVSDIIDKNIGC